MSYYPFLGPPLARAHHGRSWRLFHLRGASGVQIDDRLRAARLCDEQGGRVQGAMAAWHLYQWPRHLDTFHTSCSLSMVHLCVSQRPSTEHPNQRDLVSKSCSHHGIAFLWSRNTKSQVKLLDLVGASRNCGGKGSRLLYLGCSFSHSSKSCLISSHSFFRCWSCFS